MPAQPSVTPMLRLVSADAVALTPPSRPGNAPPRHRGPLATAAENHSAAGLSAVDARWVFAVQVARSLEGGKAAALPPERRQSLVAGAVSMGLRPFDANLVIAVVQDGVRSGGGGLTRAVEDRLALVPPAKAGSTLRAPVVIIATLLLAVGSMAALVAWLLR